MHRRVRSSILVALLAGVAASGALGACSDDPDDDVSDTTAELVGDIVIDVDAPQRCDPLDARHCLLPFPSDTFTVEDPTTDTGRRVELARESMPVNADGVHADPTEWNRNDGFSPGQPASTYVPGLDVETTGIAGVTDIGASLADDAPIVVVDATTGERHPYWAELDASVESDDARVLYVRPAVNYPEGHRIVIALRDLRDAAGDPISTTNDVFRAYRDRLRTDVPEVEARRARYEAVFDVLAEHDVARDDTLFLAWDFTIASERNLSERLLHIRDDAFAALGDGAPTFRVEQVEDAPEEELARRIRGTFDVPLYLTDDGVPGSRFVTGADGLPERASPDAVLLASFVCTVPRAALAGPGGSAVAARPAVYGHGLLGSNDEVSAGNVRRMANEHNFVFCATPWIGMSEEDIGNAASILAEIGRFPTLADRAQQGILDALFLGRLMIHADGFVSDPAFQDANGSPVIDTRELFYDGNSQGGIMGGAATAVALDWTRAVLGVTGMNYSTLLQRSIDWRTYEAVYEPSYPDEIERGIGISLIQMLWDRAETNGYAHHLTDDPLPGTPAHDVLLHIAFADHQVSMHAAEVQARTMGAAIRCPALVDDRIPDVEAHWGLECASDDTTGSVLVYWDSGTPMVPTVNLPPTEGRDPHEDPRADGEARVQKSAFLASDGAFAEVCGTGPCTATPVD
ncbi:MAG TPA: hypothetical protein VFZ83_08365 [Acidimicrobiia bacterium]|nr:hypothetical protein [Acidimicrobiia bacterium]